MNVFLFAFANLLGCSQTRPVIDQTSLKLISFMTRHYDVRHAGLGAAQSRTWVESGAICFSGAPRPACRDDPIYMGVDVNVKLVREGLAFAWPNNKSNIKDIVQNAQKKAFEDHVGMWKYKDRYEYVKPWIWRANNNNNNNDRDTT